jgi:hypothetical protein
VRTVRIVIVIPISVGAPGVVPIHAIVIAVTILAVIIIQIIKAAPHDPVMDFHAEIAIIIILISALVLGLLVFFYPYIFIFLTLGGIIHIIGGLAGFISRSASA